MRDGNTDDNRSTPPSRCVALDRVELELVSLPGKALTREGSGSLSIQPAGCTPWYSTDAVILSECGLSNNLMLLAMLH